MEKRPVVHLTTFVLIFLIFNLTSYSQKAFEGIIDYKIEVKLKKLDHLYNEYYAQKYGDTMRVYISKNGSMKREYLGSGEMGYDWAIYRQDKNEFYAKWKSMDSIFYYNCEEVMTELKSFEAGPIKQILGRDCRSIIIEAFEPIEEVSVIQKFYFSGEEYIQDGTYDKFKDGYLDKFYSTSGAHFLEWELEQNFIIVNFEAISIERKKIGKEIFKIPNGIELVKQ
ncbi:MAG: hypothetical protein AAFO07_03725 [Bacteroidota bacterium]